MKHRIFLSLLFLSLFWILPSQSAASTPVSGHAYSENIGWIQLRGFIDTNQNGIKDAGEGDYGVQFDDGTGMFSGYAWSENIGWISFAPAGPYPSSPDYSACLDLPASKSTNEPCNNSGDFTVSGWARALANGGGWEGWIKLKGTNYGVTLDTGVSPAEFKGYAWSDMVVGAISFNRTNCDPDKDGLSNGAGNCPAAGTPISDYKVSTALVLNQPPSANNLSRDDFDNTVCGVTEGARVRLMWTFNDPGDTQSAYQIKIIGDGGFDTGKVLGDSQAFVNDGSPTRPFLKWDTQYSWQLMVWDSEDKDSDWISGATFTTPKHSYPSFPSPAFGWTPQKPGVNELVQFTDTTNFHDVICSANPDDPRCSYSWTFEGGDPGSSLLRNPTTKFATPGAKTVTIETTDSDDYTCLGSASVNSQLPLPEWREIPPFSWANKFLAMVTDLFKNL